MPLLFSRLPMFPFFDLAHYVASVMALKEQRGERSAWWDGTELLLLPSVTLSSSRISPCLPPCSLMCSPPCTPAGPGLRLGTLLPSYPRVGRCGHRARCGGYLRGDGSRYGLGRTGGAGGIGICRWVSAGAAGVSGIFNLEHAGEVWTFFFLTTFELYLFLMKASG